MISPDGNKLAFFDRPEGPPASLFRPPPFELFSTSLVGVGADGTTTQVLYQWAWTSTYNGTSGSVVDATSINPSPLDPGNGTGGVTITAINGVQLPPIVPPNQVTTTASGLAYSRVSQTFNGTLTVTNIGTDPISGPVQIVFFGMPPGVALVNASGSLSGTSYLTVPASSGLGTGQSITVNVQFKNPSNATINFTPAVYSGTF
jgi:hypothetical protein